MNGFPGGVIAPLIGGFFAFAAGGPAAGVAGFMLAAILYGVAWLLVGEGARRWWLAIIGVAILYLPLYFITETLGRVILAALRNVADIQGEIMLTAIFQTNYWTYLENWWEPLTFPPVWAPAVAVAACLLAILTAQSKAALNAPPPDPQ